MAKSLPERDPHLARNFFFKHFTRNLTIGLATAIITLLIGMIGLRYFEGNDWVDAYANSAMVISGVGTITNPKTVEGKIFLGTYSILGGGIFLLIVAGVFVPIFHWIFRQMHVEDRDHF